MNNIISSKQNQYVKLAKSLQRKKIRETHNMFLVEGLRSCEEVINSGIKVECGFYTNNIIDHERGCNFLDNLRNTNILLFEVDENIFKYISDTENPQGVMFICMKKDFELSDINQDKEPVLLIIDGIQDPGNLGTIIRTAGAAAVSGIILLKGTVDPYSTKVVRSTMGALFGIPVVTMNDNETLYDYLKKQKYRFLVADISGEQMYYETDVKGPVAWVMGNEANGPNEFWINHADAVVKIPLLGKVESLNVAVATGILLYDTVRQRGI